MPPQLIKGNCFVFALMFKLKHRSSKVNVGWNNESRVVSFSVAYYGHTYHYRRKDRTQSKYWFNGRIIKKKTMEKNQKSPNNRKSNAMSFAEVELDILVKSHTDPDNRPIIEPFIPEILALINKFGNSGQSGGSAPYTASALSQAIKKLCLHEALCPITGLDEEWGSVEMEKSIITHQNKRCSALFKENNVKPYYIDAIIWKTQKGTTWSGPCTLKDGSTITGAHYVKEFPFTPKTFVIDVIETEVEKDNWDFHIKDEAQLDEVFNYYNKKVK